MKKSFIRTLSVICAALLLAGVLASWAEAGSVATPTDLVPAETGKTVEGPDDVPPAGEEPGETQPGEEPAGETPNDEENPPEGETPAAGDDAEKEPVNEGQVGEPEEDPEDKPEEKPQEKPENKPEEADTESGETSSGKPEDQPKDKPEEKPEDNQEQPAEKPEEDPEDTVEVEEILITKVLKIGEFWSGRVSKKKPAILKLEVSQAQSVHMLVEGKGVWATVVKSDHLNENPPKKHTDAETNRMIVTWKAETGSYLINIGPADCNLMSNASVTFMNDAAYEAWQAEQEAAEPENDPEEENDTEGENRPESGFETEVTEEGDTPEISGQPEGDGEEENNESGKEPAEETDEEPDNPGEGTEEESDTFEEGGEEPSETEEDELTEEEESDPEADGEEEETSEEGEPEEEAAEEEETEEEEQETEELPDEETLLSQGYFKVQVVQSEGTDVFEDLGEDAEPVEHLEMGTELWVRPTEDDEWAAVLSSDDEMPERYIRWDDLIIIRKTEVEEIEEEELPARYIEIDSTLSSCRFVSLGTEITMTARLYNFREEDACEYQWKYFDSASGDFVDIEGANEAVYTYHITEENIYYNWKLVVTILNEAE